MKHFLMRVASLALIIGGVAGLIFSVVALFVLVRIEPYVESAAMERILIRQAAVGHPRFA